MAAQANLHPYFPRDLHLPNYVANDKGMVQLLGVFFGLIAVSIAVLWNVMASRPHLAGRIGMKLKISWFAMCALIHFILEGYFSVYHRTIPEDQSFLGQMWKEYGKGDSRYVSCDTFTVCMEGITAFIDGPFAMLTAIAFLRQSPSRYVLQLITSLLQLYGDVLYFLTAAKEGFVHGPMWHPLYFGFYFVFLNSLWIVIPLSCCIEAGWRLTSAQSNEDKAVGPPAGAKKLR